MNAFDAAEKNGRADDLKKELEVLFNSQNKSARKGATSIPATFLRVTLGRQQRHPARMEGRGPAGRVRRLRQAES